MEFNFSFLSYMQGCHLDFKMQGTCYLIVGKDLYSYEVLLGLFVSSVGHTHTL